jgi:hypothetical protein
MKIAFCIPNDGARERIEEMRPEIASLYQEAGLVPLGGPALHATERRAI